MKLDIRSKDGEVIFRELSECAPATDAGWQHMTDKLNMRWPQYATSWGSWKSRWHQLRGRSMSNAEDTRRMEDEILRARAPLKLSQAQFAERVGMAVTRLSRLKNGYSFWTAEELTAIVREFPTFGVPSGIARAAHWTAPVADPVPAADPAPSKAEIAARQLPIDYDNAAFLSRARAATTTLKDAVAVLDRLTEAQLRKLVLALHRTLSEPNPLAEVAGELRQLQQVAGDPRQLQQEER